ncbi:hypothetical protein [Crocosphaera sp. XPORK-15E]|uniref:hypothetical protein n=1 Tax=Crocosphaera sp. XPORK-15E TaxID=3110247 RepID=UPI002B2148EB|nr:hypothetical protein [Crocosphaera sp. XPORK-15E]MEA5536692.1 hypothetical protein [Crocosphaera sp. XPORK-15E]
MSTMPVSRQIRYFKESRENWKERALEKQEQLRFFSQKIDDLTRSRDKTMDLTSDLIKQALETVRCRDLSEWINEIFGQSMLSKRKAVFDRSFDDMKVA